MGEVVMFPPPLLLPERLRNLGEVGLRQAAEVVRQRARNTKGKSDELAKLAPDEGYHIGRKIHELIERLCEPQGIDRIQICKAAGFNTEDSGKRLYRYVRSKELPADERANKVGRNLGHYIRVVEAIAHLTGTNPDWLLMYAVRDCPGLMRPNLATPDLPLEIIDLSLVFERLGTAVAHDHDIESYFRDTYRLDLRYDAEADAMRKVAEYHEFFASVVPSVPLFVRRAGRMPVEVAPEGGGTPVEALMTVVHEVHLCVAPFGYGMGVGAQFMLLPTTVFEETHPPKVLGTVDRHVYPYPEGNFADADGRLWSWRRRDELDGLDGGLMDVVHDEYGPDEYALLLPRFTPVTASECQRVLDDRRLVAINPFRRYAVGQPDPSLPVKGHDDGLLAAIQVALYHAPEDLRLDARLMAEAAKRRIALARYTKELTAVVDASRDALLNRLSRPAR